MPWPLPDEAQRYEKLVLANGRLFVHGVAIELRSHALEFAYTQSWHCRFAVDSSGAQGLVCGWQRMVHEPAYEAGPYGSYSPLAYGCYAAGAPGSYAAYSSFSQYGSYGADDPSGTAQSGGEVSDQPAGPSSRAFVTLVGMNEYGTVRLVYLSKIESVSVSLGAFELERADVELHFQAAKTLYEVLHVNDGADK